MTIPSSTPGAPRLVINGRFLGQTLSGVQRFAYEMTRELVSIWPHAAGPAEVLRPQGAAAEDPSLAIRVVGRRTGVLWEQLDLPRFRAGRLLLNLANTAPLIVRRQAVVIHDMGAFDTPEAYSAAFRTYYRGLQRIMANTGMTIVTVSDFSRQSISRNLGLQKETIAVVGEGADHMHRVRSEPEILVRHQLAAKAYVLVVGNLARHKNLAALGGVAVMLERRGLSLVIAGQINPVFHAGGAQLPNSARYIGRVSDGELKALFEHAACFVFPSLYEGFGLPAIEAMACRCAVLASAVPGLQETCGDAALFFDPNAPDDIAAKVARVLDHPALAARLVETGVSRARELTWTRAAGLLKAALLTRPRASAPGSVAFDPAMTSSRTAP